MRTGEGRGSLCPPIVLQTFPPLAGEIQVLAPVEIGLEFYFALDLVLPNAV